MHRYLVVIVLLVVFALGASTVAIGAPVGSSGGNNNAVIPHLIQSVSPNHGSPMDTIIIKGLNIPADKTKAEVWFTVAANTTIQGTILNAASSRDVITYWVQVPGDGSISASYQGSLYVKLKDTGEVTGSRPFRIIPSVPKITSHSPQYGAPGRTTTLRGTNFKSTDEVCVSNAEATPLIFRSATEIAVTLPSNYPTNNRLIKVYVRRKSGSSWLDGPQYTYALDPALQPESKTGNVGQKVESKEGSSK